MAKKLCSTCGVTNADGTPCGLMFDNSFDPDTCSNYVNDPKKHTKLEGKGEVKKETAKDVQSEKKEDK